MRKRNTMTALIILALSIVSTVFGQALPEYIPPTYANQSDAKTQGLWHLNDGGSYTIPGEHVTDTNSLGLWALESGSDGTTNDNDGTLQGTASIVSGKFTNCLNFPGLGDSYLSIPDAASYEPGNGDLTIEAWINPDTVSGNQSIINKWDHTTDDRSYHIRLESGKIVLYLSETGTAYTALTGTTSISSGAWTHFAITRTGDTISIFVNGALDISGNYTGTVNDSACALKIGSSYGTANPFDGKIDDVRISNNVRYLATTTVDDSANVNDGTFAGNAQIVTNGKFGNCADFQATSNSYISIPDSSALELGGNDFTVECWIKPDSVSGTSSIVNKWDHPNNQRSFNLRIESGHLTVYLSNDGATYTTLSSAHNSITADVWTHISVERVGSTVRFKINGTPDTSMTYTDALFDGSGDWRIGSHFGTGTTLCYDGKIDELRISSIGNRNDGVMVQAPTTSQVSPVCIEGINYMPGQTVTSGSITAKAISNSRFYADVSLLSNGTATSISHSFTNRPETINTSTTWIATDISSNGSITIRKGDHLLLTSTGTGTALGIDTDYDSSIGFSADHTGAPSDTFVQQFNTAGVFTMGAQIDGVSVGTYTVSVADINFNGSTACEIGYQREKLVNILGVDSTDINFSTVNGEAESSYKEDTIDGTIIYIKPLISGIPTVLSRINGDSGPILASQEIEEFELTTQATQFIFVTETYEDDSFMVETNLLMTPNVSNLEIQLDIIVSGVTFDDSTLDKTVMSGSFTGSNPALFPYKLLQNADVTTGTCHTIKVYQNNVQIGQ